MAETETPEAPAAAPAAPPRRHAVAYEWSDTLAQEEQKDREAVRGLEDPAPQSSQKRLYYTATQVAQHNSERDCWVSLLGKVFDITALIASNEGSLTEPLTNFAGQDLSHWFDPETEDLRTRIDAETGLEVYFTPHGAFVHVVPPEPTNDFNTRFLEPWWRDPRYWIGYLSSQPRKIRVINTLTKDEHTIEVCGEESIHDIQAKYLAYNQHAESYVWKRLATPEEGTAMISLDMELTLAENGLKDESLEYDKLGIDEDFYVPCLMIYFKDDLTSA